MRCCPGPADAFGEGNKRKEQQFRFKGIWNQPKAAGKQIKRQQARLEDSSIDKQSRQQEQQPRNEAHMLWQQSALRSPRSCHAPAAQLQLKRLLRQRRSLCVVQSPGVV